MRRSITLDNSMRLYRRIRDRVRELLNEAKQAGYESIRIEGEWRCRRDPLPDRV